SLGWWYAWPKRCESYEHASTRVPGRPDCYLLWGMRLDGRSPSTRKYAVQHADVRLGDALRDRLDRRRAGPQRPNGQRVRLQPEGRVRHAPSGAGAGGRLVGRRDRTADRLRARRRGRIRTRLLRGLQSARGCYLPGQRVGLRLVPGAQGPALTPTSEMSEITHREIETNGIRMHVAEQGTGPLVVLCHGFPESWYSWRHQLAALSAAGFHAVAPD